MDGKKKLLNRNIKLIIALLIFVSIGAGVTYSATTYLYDSNVIGYDNSNSGLASTDVQGALDELYNTCVNSTNSPEGHICYENIEVSSVFSNNAVRDDQASTYVTSSTGINFAAVSSNTNGKGLYLRAGTELTGHPIYYYRGAVDNNYVIFANFCWRIVRTTETGGIKLVYHSPAGSNQCPTSTSNAYIGITAYNSGNLTMQYKIDSFTNSTIKTVVDNWYAQYMTNYTSYLEDTVWCNDTTGGAVARLINSKTPTFDCTLDSDKYTVSSVNGNGLLTYPVALLTADEVAFAGGLYLEDFMSFYLYSGLLSWTMTAYNSSYAFAYGEGVDSITNTGVNVSSRYARPAISLKPSTTFITGNGTANNPYVVATETQSTFSCPPDYVCYKKIDVLPMFEENAISDGIASTYVTSSSGINFSENSSDTNGKGLYVRAGTINSEHPIYYYRGNVNDNHVLFANYCWRIIRTTDTGGIKLIYNGTPSDGQCLTNTGNNTQIGTSLYGNNTYYMNSSTNSTIKTNVDNWFSTNIYNKNDTLGNSYASYLEDTVWCSDGTSNSKPNLTCNSDSHKYTVSSTNGNGLLTYPVGLVTIDEVILSGGIRVYGSTSYYLYTAKEYYTMSSYASGGGVYVVNSSGTIIDSSNVYGYGVRPMVSLKNGVTFFKGNGSTTNPYYVALYSN